MLACRRCGKSVAANRLNGHKCTHCRRGHPPEDAYVWTDAQGNEHRRCRLCRQIARVAHQPKRTHCQQGHLLDAANTYVYIQARGFVDRRCRKCARQRHREWKARQDPYQRARIEWRKSRGLPAF